MVRRFVGELRLTGQYSFDFIEAADGTPYAIECNPRTHSAVTMFYDHPDLARAYLDRGVPTIRPRPSARPTYWLYHELWRVLTQPEARGERLLVVLRGIARADDGELGLIAKDATRAWTVDPSDPVTEAVWDAARTCHEALGCRDYSLFDFRVDPDGRPWFLEAGLYCSFTRKSVVVMMAEAGGIPVRELFATAVRQAVGRQAADRPM